MNRLVSNLQNRINNPTDTNDPKNSMNIKSEELLKKQQESTSKLSALLEQSLNTLSCGPTCQKIKTENELNQKYLNAKTNMQTAPVQLETTRKNYYVFKEGQPYYDNMLEEELKKKSEIMGNLLAKNFQEEIANAKLMNEYYNTELTNSLYTKELYDVYLEKNKLVQAAIKNNHADVLTNDRKTYYETEALEDLKNWYTFLWYVFYLFVMPIFIFTLFLKSSLHFIVRIIIVYIAFAYPYYIDPILRWIYGIFHSFWKQLPKNVYNDL
jgi:hypothetical protein